MQNIWIRYGDSYYFEKSTNTFLQTKQIIISEDMKNSLSTFYSQKLLWIQKSPQQNAPIALLLQKLYVE